MTETRQGKQAVHLDFLARVRVGRDVAKDGVDWSLVLRAAALSQLGEDWLKRIVVGEAHAPRRVEIIRRCRRKLSDEQMKAGCGALLLHLEATKLEPGWFFRLEPKFVTIHLVQLETDEDPWLEITLFGR